MNKNLPRSNGLEVATLASPVALGFKLHSVCLPGAWELQKAQNSDEYVVVK